MIHETKRRIVLVGATGLIGRAIRDALRRGDRADRYEVLGISRASAPRLDLEAPETISPALEALAPFQHVIVAAGSARFAPLHQLDGPAFELGLRSKLMGQVHVALAALRRLPPGGSVTLTSGALSHAPIPGSAPVALVNGAIDAFVRAVALDAPGGRRINVVSPGWITETRIALGLDPSPGVSAREVAELYLQAIEGPHHGQVLEHAPASASGDRTAA